VNFAFTPEQEELRRTARRFLDQYSTSKRVRAAMATAEGFDPEVWQRIATDLGWPALIIPEQYGGAGLGFVELVALQEELGRALLCAPFFSSVCLATNAILIGGNEEQKDRALPDLASGKALATLAWIGPNGRPGAHAVEATARRDGGDYLLSGLYPSVLDGHTAGSLVVAARTPASDGENGINLFLVSADTSGIERRPLATMDQTRKCAELRLNDVRVSSSALLGEEGAGFRPLRRTLELACVALAAEQVGGAQRCLDTAVEYAKTRVQFGRPIGSFQAIKHKCADMLVEVESARSASYWAGWVAAHDPAELPIAAPLAKAYCSEAYFHCAAENIQIHGGIGFTWEHDAHLHFKRARAGEALLGNPSYHRELIAQRIGL
jgi:alkylation response protein AidB-like acyl-CoA dehydrogenase